MASASVERPVTGRLSLVRATRVGLAAAPDLVGVVDLFCRLRLLEAWPELRTLLDDEARLESLAVGGIAGPDHTIEAMRFAAAGRVYVIEEFELECLANAEAVLIRARARYVRSDEGVYGVNWLVTAQDGLIWRARMVAAREEAELILEREGIGLGL